ncbi:MAG: hypothetical protein COA47_17185 [Robiginitomaculum sp.]|nr:MAG: hypothetical protein COA47_17185 [Robiginitomaculum sp.]
MRHMILIARREYLSYVATIGFWVSLCMIPIFLILGLALPVLLDRASPTRNFTVIDPSGRFISVMETAISDDRKEQIGAVLDGLILIDGETDGLKAARQALADGRSEAEIAALLGPRGKTTMAAVRSDFRLVPAPAQTADGLRPFLIEDKKLDTPRGPETLSAAILIDSTEDQKVGIQYWSTNITEQRLKRLVRNAVRDQMRLEGFARAGIDFSLVQEITDLGPQITSLSPEKNNDEAEVTAQDRMPYMVAIMFAFVLWSVVFSVANMLLTSVIEEKSNKILDSLLCAAPLRSILIGKLFGVAAVSFTLLAGWAMAGLLTAWLASTVTHTNQDNLNGLLFAASNPGLFLPFFGYFVFGYLMFGSIFLALGSLCETLQEAQTLMTPMIFLMMVPMMALVFVMQDPQSPILMVLSWIPLFTPYIMMARLPTDPALSEIIGTTLVMVATTVLVLWAAGRVFRAGTMYGAGSDYFKKMLTGLLSKK